MLDYFPHSCGCTARISAKFRKTFLLVVDAQEAALLAIAAVRYLGAIAGPSRPQKAMRGAAGASGR